MATQNDVDTIDQAYGKAVANRDPGAIAALYSADAYLLPPNAPLAQGRPAIEAVVQSYLDAGAQSLELSTVTLEEQGDLVVEVGRYTLGVQTPDGDSVTDVGKYLQVFKRQADGSLLIAFDAFNSDESIPE